MAGTYQYGDTSPVVAGINTAQAVNVADLVGYTSGSIVRAQDQAFNTSILQTQQDFAALFLGASGQQKDNVTAVIFGNSVANVCRVDTSGVFQYDCVVGNYALGSYVAPAANSGNNGLLSQVVAPVGSVSAAIGQVVEAASSASKVKIKLLSSVLPASR